MGAFIIKKEGGKEVVYEKGIVDRKIGELHETLTGPKETRNVFGVNVKVEREGFLSSERKAQAGDEKGVFSKNFLESHPTFKPEKERSREETETSYCDESSYYEERNGQVAGQISKEDGWEIWEITEEWLSTHIGRILFSIVSIAIFSGAMWVKEHVAEYSLVFWLSFAVAVACLPGCIIGLLYLLAIMFAALILLGIIWGIVELIKYFIQNPW